MAKKDIKYDPSFVDKLPGMFSQGEDVLEVCADLGICKTTFYEWVIKYPEFKHAYSLAKEKSKAWWLKLGRAGACGKADINPAVWIFNMKAKFGYSDKPAEEPREETNQVINITIVPEDGRKNADKGNNTAE